MATLIKDLFGLPDKVPGGIGGVLARADHSALHTPESALAYAYYHCDGNGNVTCLINTNGQVVARYNYDPYGILVNSMEILVRNSNLRIQLNVWNREYNEKPCEITPVYFNLQ
ncbi:MAG: hypothetical protein M9920_00475 [Verrucomicrobiae bacterium]|nr:hypothetical protein [Verrucomicrobiae bacterium]